MDKQMKETLVLIFGLLFVIILPIKTQSVRQVNELKRRLLKDYDKTTLPHDHSISNSSFDEEFQIVVYIHPVAVGDLDEINEQMSSVLAFVIGWNDSYIRWNPEENHGIEKVTFGVNDVWKPNMLLLNPHQQDIQGQTDKQLNEIIFKSGGETTFLMITTTHTTCDIATTNFPFDIQSCTIQLLFGIDFDHYADLTCEWLEKENVKGNGAWTLIKSNIETDSSKVYITLTFARKPMFMLLNILLPLVVLVTLTPMVFLLSKGSGERIAYSLTMLLSISVYMTIVNEHLPKNSDPMPLISVMIFIWYILTALIVLIVIINIQISRIKNKRRIPGCVCCFVKLTRWINRKETLSYSACAEETEPCLESKNIKDDDTCGEILRTPIRITWVEVSVAIDKWCFIGFYIIKFVVPAICIAVMAS